MKNLYNLLLTFLFIAAGSTNNLYSQSSTPPCASGSMSGSSGYYGEYISSFSTSGAATNISNTSNFSNGGGDYTSQYVEVYSGSATSVNYTFTTPQSSYGGTFIIVLDTDNNGQFASSEVLDSQYATSGSGSITIPSGLAEQDYNLRIAWSETSSTYYDTCGYIGYGEFEDYTVRVSSAPSCIPATSVSASSVSASSVVISWLDSNSSPSFEIEYGVSGFSSGSGSTVSVSSSPYTLQGLTSNTSYDAYVKTICSDGSTAISSSISFTTLCDNITSFPYTNGFESFSCLTVTGDSPWQLGDGSNEGPDSVTEGLTAAYFADYDYYENETSDIITPILDFSYLTVPYLYFDYYDESNADTVEVYLIDSSENETLLYTTDAVVDSWTTIEIDLSAYAGMLARIAFRGTSVYGYSNPHLDNLIISEAPSCADPSALTSTVSDFVIGGASISWDAGNGNDNFNYNVYEGTDTTSTAVDSGSTTTTSLDLSGLSDNQLYTFELTSMCGSESTTAISTTFTTANKITGASTETFSGFTTGNYTWGVGGNSSGSWYTTNGNLDWVNDVAGTPSGSTGPSAGSTDGSATDVYLFIETSEGSVGDIATLMTPYYDVSSMTSPRIAFDYHMYGATTGDLNLYVVESDGTETSLVSISGQQQSSSSDDWLTATADLSSYMSEVIRFKITGSRSTDYTGDIAIDDFTIEETPTCPAPSDLSATATSATEATVSWNAGGSETTWEYVYQAVGTGEPTETGSFTTTNSLSLSGLTSSTDYEIYLRADCGGSPPPPGEFTGSGDTSTWVSTTFTTPVGCGDTVTHCYTSGNYEIFDSSVDNAGDYITVTINAGETESGYDDLIIYDSLDNSGNALYTADGDHSGVEVISTTGLISVWIDGDSSYNCTDGGGGPYTPLEMVVSCAPDTEAPVITLVGDDPLELNIGDTYTDPGATATDNADGDLTSSIVVGGDTVDTSASGTFTVTYDVSDAAGNAATQVTRVVNVSCPAPTNLSVSNLAETSVTLNWTSTGTAFMVELQPTGVPQGSGSTYGGYVIGDFEPIPTSYVDLPAGSLPANTSIDFWVVNICGTGENSTYAGPFTFVTLADTEAPVMSLIGDDPLELNIGDTYTEQGVTITDNIDSGQTLQAALQIGGDTVNTSVAGSYTITYDVSDVAGNQATQVTRVVIVNPPALELRGILDLSLGGTDGKGAHVVANDDISDLSIYGIGVVFNGNGASGIDYTFPAISVSSGDHILILAQTPSVIQAYLGSCYDGFDYVYSGVGIAINGDDAIELFENGAVIETFGDINVDGSGEDWDYLDSWAYKVDGVWTYGGINCTDNSTTTSSSNCPYPFCGSDWTGDVSTAWHSDGNWSDGSVPDYTKDVTIATGLTNYPTVSTDASANSVSVATSATLTISENGSLSTTGDFTNAGTVTMNSDSQEFSSLIVGGTSSGDINYNRFVNQYSVPGDDNIQWDLIGSPVDGLEISSFANDNPSLATSGDYFAVGTYDNSTQLWTNYTSANATGVNFDMGLGYQMGTLSGSTLSFEGSVTTANQTQTISDNSGSGGDYWNLVSNPYPSYLNLNESSDATDNFVSENSVSIYGWNAGSTGAYTVYNQISPTPNAAQYLAPGQGFFVSAEIASQVTFTNAMQTVSGSDDFVSGRMDNAFTYFYLKLNEGDNTVANSMFYFGDGMAYGYDAGYDAEAFSQSTKIMSRALEGNVELGMQVNAMPKEALDDSTVIPLEVNQTAGTAFSIGLTDVVNLAENVEVYLEDTELQTLTDLKVEDYTLNPSYDLSGAGRFYLVFGANSLGGTTIDESYISIYKAANDDFVTIEGLLNVEKANVQLFNIIGQEVLNTTLKTNQSTQRISTTELAAGVYVIKLKADNAVISKKLIIN